MFGNKANSDNFHSDKIVEILQKQHLQESKSPQIKTANHEMSQIQILMPDQQIFTSISRVHKRKQNTRVKIVPSGRMSV